MWYERTSPWRLPPRDRGVSALPLVTQPQRALFWDDPTRDSCNGHTLSRPRYAAPRYAHNAHIARRECGWCSYPIVAV